MQTGRSFREREEKLETRNWKLEIGGERSRDRSTSQVHNNKSYRKAAPHPFWTNRRKDGPRGSVQAERGPAPTSIPYGQDRAVCIAHHFVSKVPRHVGRRFNMPRAVQAQNDEIGFESVGSQQDLFTRYSVLDHKFRLDSHLGMLQIQSIELPLASQSRLVSHLREIAGG